MSKIAHPHLRGLNGKIWVHSEKGRMYVHLLSWVWAALHEQQKPENLVGSYTWNQKMLLSHSSLYRHIWCGVCIIAVAGNRIWRRNQKLKKSFLVFFFLRQMYSLAFIFFSDCHTTYSSAAIKEIIHRAVAHPTPRGFSRHFRSWDSKCRPKLWIS